VCSRPRPGRSARRAGARHACGCPRAPGPPARRPRIFLRDPVQPSRSPPHPRRRRSPARQHRAWARTPDVLAPQPLVEGDGGIYLAHQRRKAWPYEEARKLLKRYPDGRPGGAGDPVRDRLRPSGLPHLGTFQEVARTQMVRHALTELTDWPTRLIAFSDDMDGMRKVPPGVPNQEMMRAHLDQPLSRVPDPFGTDHPSFAAHNNAMLRQFLDRFGFDYEFLASTDCYRSGRFDETLRAGPAQLRRDHGRDAARPCARSGGRPIRPSCRSAPHRQGAAGAGRGGRRRGRH
jgi:hypothetical protein